MSSQGQQPLLPAYLVVGEDALKRRTVLERLRKRLASLGDLDFNHDEFDGDTADGGAIAAACNTLPFASPIRLVEVSRVEKLSKQSTDVLVAYLAAPNETTVLALSGEKLGKNTRLYKAVDALGKSAVIDCAPMKRYELQRALRSMAVGHGFAMTEQAADALITLVGEDTVRLDGELRKLALSHKGTDPVNEREVKELVARTSEVKPWELVDAFSARDARRCIALLPLLGSVTPYALMSMCTARIRELICAKSYLKRGEPNRIPDVLKMPAWRLKNHVAWSERYTDAELRKALSTARDCERAMKSGTDPDLAFKDWMLATMAK